MSVITLDNDDADMPTPLGSPVKKQRTGNLDQLKSSEDLQDALAFVQKSCTLAKRCMVLQQYGCAFRILAKVEETTQLIAKESRRGILSKVNQHQHTRSDDATDDDESFGRMRKVSFSDDVCVGLAEDIDRSISPIPRPSVHEMLYVRAYRDIPTANLSDYWVE
ncbi:hypothetical protein DYB37_001443 [Aphanomyces astaci]|nr:hypothetical protein DYB36_007298 [Aphanomyces astaci]RHY17099.1 hypothetical protein DYB25_003093 [Aphanomyces astaci]RHY47018.1 hypothetical protein DYB34_007520 [Aphanomyces astaci]RHY69175.1 hypothetical protein DYB38_007714 [Aphanomyces astaci]RHY80272.1 hypothetical protein DYB30_002834 [Aphanomyces astaci]